MVVSVKFASVLMFGQSMEETLAIRADIVNEKWKVSKQCRSSSNMSWVLFEHVFADG